MIIFDDIIDTIIGLGKIGVVIFVGVVILGTLAVVANNVP